MTRSDVFEQDQSGCRIIDKRVKVKKSGRIIDKRGKVKKVEAGRSVRRLIISHI